MSLGCPKKLPENPSNCGGTTPCPSIATSTAATTIVNDQSIANDVVKGMVTEVIPGSVGLQLSLADIVVEWANSLEKAKPGAKARLDTYAELYAVDEAVSMAMKDNVVRFALSKMIINAGFKDYDAEKMVREYILMQQSRGG